MPNIYKKISLVAVSGELKGKRFKIKDELTTLGSEKSCSITVPGQKVGPIHAELLLKTSGEVELRNKSHWGTLVNQARCDIETLRPDDTIQIGETTLFRFEATPVKSKTQASDSENKGILGLLKQYPGASIGIGIYLLMMLAIGLVLSTGKSTSADSGLSQAYLQEALDGTRAYLLEITPDESALTLPIDQRADRGARYFAITRSSDKAERSALLDELMGDLEYRFFLAWALERQDNPLGALDQYEYILALVPDANAATTKVANWRINTINSQVTND